MICRTRSIPDPYRSICPCDNFLHVSSAYPFLTRDGDKDLFADLLKPPPVRSKPIEDATLEDTGMRDALTDSSRIATNPGEL